MATTLKLSDALINKAKRCAEENPDLPLSFIQDILIARQEVADGDVTPFEFD